ncbi:hypothetical protein [Roseibium album]|uniref:hypothetical protein n=1 Tax=Roseibium album TaxID=311410 RepID=UPI00329755A2
MSDSSDEDLLGPGSDLAIAFSGILIMVLLIVFSLGLLQSKKRSAAEDLLAAKAVKIDQITQNVAAAHEQVDDLQDNLEENKSRIESEVERATALNARVRELEETLMSVRTDLNTKTDRLAIIRNEYRVTTAKQRNLQKLSAVLEDKLEEKAATLASQLERNERLSARLEELTHLLEESTDDNQALENIETELKVENERLRDELADKSANSNLAESFLSENQALTLAVEKLEMLRQEYKAENDRLNVEVARLNDKPPIIVIKDADGYSFKSGSAELSDRLRVHLARRTVPLIADNALKFKTYVVEVIGHTDEVPIGRRSCNLDGGLLHALEGRMKVGGLIPCDNTGLGMARAISVVRELRRAGLDYRYTLRPLSAGQTTLPNGSVASPQRRPIEQAARRRIEIRLRQR